MVLYEKIYPSFNIPDTVTEENTPLPPVSANEFLRQLIENCVYVAIPERLRLKNTFINKAIAFSELYEISLKITENKGSVIATFTFEQAAFFTRLKEVFLMSDEILVLSDSREDYISICLTYYTHRIEKKSGGIIQEI